MVLIAMIGVFLYLSEFCECKWHMLAENCHDALVCGGVQAARLDTEATMSGAVQFDLVMTPPQ